MDIQNFLPHLAEQIQAQTRLDWAITLTALIYVVLAARENVWCWVWGMISCSLWAYADFARYNLWVDGILQIFYAGMSAWGIYSWMYGGKTGDAEKTESKALKISRLPLNYHLAIFAAGGFLTLVLGFIFEKYTPTALAYPDSFITSFSMLATLLTIRKILENWLYWIVLDFLAIFLFAAREAYLVAFVMAVYTVIAVFGYIHWRKKWAVQSSDH